MTHVTGHRMQVAPTPQARRELLDRLGLPLPLRSGYSLLREADGWAQLGDTLVRQQRPEAALAAFEQAYALEPSNKTFLDALLAILVGLKRPGTALDILRQTAETAARLTAESTLLLELNEADAALEHCDRALEIDPDGFTARLNRGSALRTLGRQLEALANDRELALRHQQHPLARYNHGDALLMAGRAADALDELDQALHLSPGFVQALMAKGLALSLLRRFQEATDAFSSARHINMQATEAYLANASTKTGSAGNCLVPDDPLVIYCAWVAMAQRECSWQQRSVLENLLRTIPDQVTGTERSDPGLAYNALLLDLDQGTLLTISRHRATQAARAASRWHWLATLHRQRGETKQEVIRIGYISPEFRTHPTAENHWRQITLHDRSRYQVFAYSLLDAGPCPARDKIKGACDHFVELSRLPADMVARRIAIDGIDILVNISGYTDFTRPEVLAARPAALQVQLMGTPGPSGASFVDYRITDLTVTPPDEAAWWDEKLVWLPETFWFLDDTTVGEAAPLRSQCGLPDSAFVFCCFNNHQKIDPACFDVWMRLLADVQSSVLWLIAGSSASENNLKQEAIKRGIDSKRLVFAPKIHLAGHLARHACADLFLDTFHYTAHTTAADALTAGLPVLTYFGKTMAGRISASLVRAAGAPEMVASSLADYEARARHLAANRNELATIRRHLIGSRDTAPLFQVEQRVRYLEQAFEQMWARHCAGLPPAHIEIKP